MRSSIKTILTGAGIALGGLWLSALISMAFASFAIGLAAALTGIGCMVVGIALALGGYDQMVKENRITQR